MAELCDEGQKLWDNSCGEHFSKTKYKRYRNHLRVCKICQHGLELTEENLHEIVYRDIKKVDRKKQ